MSYIVIDVSEWQGKIDWDKAWKSGAFKAVILRCGYGNNEFRKDDKQWVRNVTACERLGIPYGVYLYSYSNGDDIQSEIDHVLRLIKGHSPTLPVYLDLEEAKYKKVFMYNAKKFCEAITKAGYKAGVYSGAYLFREKLLNLNDKYSRWVASYGQNKNGKLYESAKPVVCEDGWQYTSTGTVTGISGKIDMSIFYTDYLKGNIKNKTKEEKKGATTMGVTPITDYSKYKNQVSNCGSDENGRIRGGKAGDQTGREWWIKSFNDFGQNQIIRFNDREIANTFATISIYSAQNDEDGYDQDERTTYWNQLKKVGYDPRKITTANESDCSAGVLANVKAALYLTGHSAWAEKINVNGYTGNLMSIIKCCGASVTVFTDSLHCRSNKYQLPGDINNNSARHVNVNLGLGSMMSQADVIGKKVEVETKKPTQKECVKKLQLALNASYGYSFKGDGKYGSNTKKAVNAHYLYYKSSTIVNEHVKWLQQMLKWLGFDIDVDGSFGRQTEAVVKAFQKKYKLTVDGYAGQKTHDKIVELFK